MRTVSFLTALLCISLGMFVPSQNLYAEESSLTESSQFNNENWQTRTQPVVATFTSNPDGSSYGITTDGIPFTQYTVSDVDGIQIQRFEMQDHYHFIVEGEVAYSLEALSTLLATIEDRHAPR